MKHIKENITPKKVISFIINFIIMFLIYKVILYLGYKLDVMIYYVGITAYIFLTAILFCIFYAKNGFVLRLSATPPEELPDDMSPVQKTEFLNSERKKKASAAKILYVLIPMAITIIINYAELYFPILIEYIF